MQPGFAMCETGLTRAKNAGNIVMKNVMDFALGTPAFWIVGFGLMFGTDIGGFIGTPDFFVTKFTVGEDAGYPVMAFLIFQTVFCATAATIVSGSMAERTKFSSYCIYSILISLFIYPVSGHWIWGGGWLAQMGFHDFAGSTAVHMVGGVCACIGAYLLGPRIGKYNADGSVNAIPGHSLPLATLGVFIRPYFYDHQHGRCHCDLYRDVFYLVPLRQTGCIHDPERRVGRSGRHHRRL